ncbi:MAG: tetratricopeptide repeat protein, partial [Bacteroidia bacterium]|nr:tetratricopeptide repeat protein [Bacteroidia bacterium]
FDAIIQHIPSQDQVISAKAIYFIAMSHYMLADDKLAVSYMDSAINMGPADYNMYYYKGRALINIDKAKASLYCFEKAIEGLPDEPDFYAGKALAFQKLKKIDSAQFYYAKAHSFPNCKALNYILSGDLFQENCNIPSALVKYEQALNKLDKSDELYPVALFLNGLMNKLMGNINIADSLFNQVLLFNTTSYQTIAHRILIYYSWKQFDKAMPYKQKLYEAHANSNLPGSSGEMFCIDQFVWNGKVVVVLESFNKYERGFATKHQFVIKNDKCEPDLALLTQTLISESSEKNGLKYKLVKFNYKPRVIYNYDQLTFKENYEYVELKNSVLDILNNKIKPTNSYSPKSSTQSKAQSKSRKSVTVNQVIIKPMPKK